MAVLALSALVAASAGINPGAYDAYALPAPGDAVLATAPVSGAHADNSPIDIAPQATVDGGMGRSFAGDWFNRIHVYPSRLDLGNLSSAQERSIEVWSAYLEPRTLTSVTEQGTEGIDLTGVPALPDVWQPLEANTYTLAIGLSGPPVIDASIGLVFDSETPVIEITGSRITAWVWSADWSRPVTERLAWLTDVITSYDGTEQRRRLRTYPRHSWEFQILEAGDARREMETAIWGWQSRAWALPIWPEVQPLAQPLQAGDQVIACDTTAGRFAPDQLVMLYRDRHTYELAEVQTVAAGQLTLTRTLVNDWPAGTRLYPARVARMRDTQPLARLTSDITKAVVQFDGIDTETAIGTLAEPSYRGAPVLERRPHWSGALSGQLLRDLEILDNQIGPQVVQDKADRTRRLQEVEWIGRSRDDTRWLREWLAARAGQWAPVWVPTWSADVVPAAPLVAEASNLDILAIGYKRLSDIDIGRRDLRIELVDGTVVYRRILSSSEVDADTERLVVEGSVGVTAQPEQVRLISFMALARLDADRVEIQHLTDGVARVRTRTRTIHDV